MSAGPTHKGFFGRTADIIRLGKRAYAPYGKQISLLVGLGLISGIIEGIGINAAIPLLTFVINQGGQADDAISNIIRTAFVSLDIDFAPKFLLSFIVILFLVRALLMFAIVYIQTRITTDYEFRTRRDLFRAVLNSSWSHLIKQRLGHLETVTMIDIPASMNLLRKSALFMNLLLGLLIYLAVAFNISALITAVTLSLGIGVFVASRPVLARIRGFGNQRVQLNRELNHHVGQTVSGMKMVKSAGVEVPVIRKAESLFVRSKEITTNVSLWQQVIVLSIPPLGVLYIALIFGLAFRTHFITLAALPAIMYLIYKIFVYVQQAQDGVQSITELIPHLQSTLAYQSIANGYAEERTGSKPLVFTQSISFESVEFAYEDGTEALKKASFVIPKGKMVGLIGPSGAGKTTTVDLMLRLFVPKSGSIRIDGVDLHEISLDEWRRRIGYVSQDVFLINETIRNNIALYDETISDADIREAIRLAHFEDVVARSAEGLDTMIGDRGINLSAGQRQRLVIARALARKPEILVLDEATSALDNESEEHIKQAIHSLKGKMTIVAIAHRLSTVMDADILIAMEKGSVIESGSPKELLKDKDSYFFKVNAIAGA